METCDSTVAAKKIYESGFVFFTAKTLKDVLAVEKRTNFFNLVNKLVKSDILQKIEKNKYLLKGGRFSDFALANFLYSPSYISFESALNFHGLLAQFPLEKTSATTKKSVRKQFEGKDFSYVHLQKKLFWGYEKKDDFLIALPEKALLDQLYLTSRGLKKIDLEETDFSIIDKDRLKEYFLLFPKNKQFLKIWKSLEKYL